jgi:hypothetical protein
MAKRHSCACLRTSARYDLITLRLFSFLAEGYFRGVNRRGLIGMRGNFDGQPFALAPRQAM